MSVPEDTDPSLFRAGAVHVSGILSAQRSVGAGSGGWLFWVLATLRSLPLLVEGLSLARLEFHSTVLCEVLSPIPMFHLLWAKYHVSEAQLRFFDIRILEFV